MKFGINTLLWTAAFGEEHFPLLERIKAGGFDGVEIARFSFEGFPMAKVRRALADSGLECTVCTALSGSQTLLAPPGEAAREATLKFLREAIDASGELGAPVLAGPFCSAVGYLPGRRRTEDEWSYCAEGLLSLAPALDAARLNLAVEPLNRFETFFLNTAADAVKLCEAAPHPRIGVLFDTFHSNVEEKSIPAAVATAGKHILHFHASENDRGTPGTGHVPWAETFHALRVLGYDDWAVIESFGSGIPEIAAATSIWRDLAATPDDIAFEGVKFLKTL